VKIVGEQILQIIYLNIQILFPLQQQKLWKR